MSNVDDNMRRIQNDLSGRLDKSTKSEADVARFERHIDSNGQVTGSIYLSNGRSFSVAQTDLQATQKRLTGWLQQNGYQVSESAERFGDFDGNNPIDVQGVVIRAKPKSSWKRW